jgi:predicted DCC family thiol-disulfide oxidoreductase YuxK
MWILLITILIVTGGLAIIDAPARARRHAAERSLVLHALARAGSYDTEAGVASGLRGRATPWASARIIRAQLTALEEDGALLAYWSGTGASRMQRYRLLVDVPVDETVCEPEGSQAVTVYYDAGCALCAAEIAHYRRAQGAAALTFVDAATEGEDTRIATDLSREAALARFHVRDTSGRLVSGAAAFAVLWMSLPRWRWLGRIAGFAPVLPFAERAYLSFLPLRPRLARLLVRLGIIGQRACTTCTQRPNAL